jgi:hypothetical protein
MRLRHVRQSRWVFRPGLRRPVRDVSRGNPPTEGLSSWQSADPMPDVRHASRRRDVQTELMGENELTIQRRLPPELAGWVVVKSKEEPGWWDRKRAFNVWLERVMPDGTTLRFEATLHDLEYELAMLVPIIVAVTNASAPNLRLSVTRSTTTRFELERGRTRRQLTGK